MDVIEQTGPITLAHIKRERKPVPTSASDPFPLLWVPAIRRAIFHARPRGVTSK